MFHDQLNQIYQKVDSYVLNKVVQDGQRVYSDTPSLVYFENINIREVARVISPSGTAYLIVEHKGSVQDLASSQSSPTQVLLILEDQLDESTTEFIRGFMPSDNQVESLIQRMDETAHENKFMADLEIQMSQVIEQKNELQK
jgi:hypothetical protein